MLALSQIENISKELGNKTVLITEDNSFSWKDYKNLVRNNLAKLIEEKFLDVDTTRAVVISENNWQLFILYSCLVTSKIAYSGIDYTMSDTQKNACIKQSGANIVFYSDNNKPSDELIKELGKDIRFINLSVLENNIVDNYTININKLVDSLKHEDDILSFSFTSGTTGLPKCIYRKSSFDKRRLGIFTDKYKFTKEDIYLVTMPFYHVSVNGWAKLTLVNGGTVVFGDFNNSEDLYFKITNYHITSMLITPPVMKPLLKVLHKNKYVNKSVRFIMVGGKNFPTILKEDAINTFGEVVNEYYGSSETGINTLADSLDMIKYPSSSGKFMEGSNLAIIGKNNEVLPKNKIGRIAINSFQCSDGYIGKIMEDIYINKERYILTSDYGYINNDGYIFVTQRVLFDSNKVTSDLFNLENEIRTIKGVDDLVIVEDKDDKFTLNVLLNDDVSQMYKSIIINTINDLTNQILPNSKILIVSDINYSLSGKVKYGEFLQAN